jgi:hypothetical protein
MLVEEHLIDFTALAMSLADMGGDMINRVMPKGAGRHLLCQFLCHCWLSFSVLHWTDVNMYLMSISWSWLAFPFMSMGSVWLAVISTRRCGIAWSFLAFCFGSKHTV